MARAALRQLRSARPMGAGKFSLSLASSVLVLNDLPSELRCAMGNRRVSLSEAHCVLVPLRRGRRFKCWRRAGMRELR